MTETKKEIKNMSAKSSEVPTNQEKKVVENKEANWIIVWKGYTNEYHNCKHPVSEYLTCGATKKLLRLTKDDPSHEEKWICANHANNYKLVGEWSKTWQREFETKETEKNLIILKGITTSQIRKREKLSDTPAYCFFKTNEQEQDIPVIFRIKETPTYEGFIQTRIGKYINYSKCYNTSRGSKCMYEDAEKCGECIDKFKTEFENCEKWIKPKIKKGSYLEVKGQWTINQQSPKGCIMRKSFTAYSYQELEPQAVLDLAKSQLPHFEQAYQQIKATREYLESHDK